jgi:hypothetical protein
MGVPKAVRHSHLLAVPLAERCRSTTPVDKPGQPCRALFGDGWRWHSCDLDPFAAHLNHRCPCGHTWPATTTTKTRRT